MMVASGLATLERGTAMKLLLRRLAPGKYDIDGRKVTVRWGCEPGKGAELLAREDEVSDSSAAEMPLVAYLSQAANVAASLSGQRSDMPKIARIPKAQRLTFADAAADSTKDATAQIDKVGNQRCESMRIACEQARLREEAAVAYEDHQHGGQHGMFAPGPLQRSLRPPSGLPLYLN
ncbi:unnamed protein product [Prorocentrum cordatum]|uniref:Uncharacterized protein n=1 Tax=Prorocentrum cordatum TaxID=2364126 RepID=A0ABN9U816_9DINO|nr:unnamed protein product [Polarella glacialis]